MSSIHTYPDGPNEPGRISPAQGTRKNASPRPAGDRAQPYTGITVERQGARLVITIERARRRVLALELDDAAYLAGLICAALPEVIVTTSRPRAEQ